MAPDGVGFPTIPGVRYTGLISTSDLFDFDRRFDDGILDFRTVHGQIVSLVASSPYPVMCRKSGGRRET